MIRHGQKVLEVFEIEKADIRFDDHVDRHHQEQLLQDDKERTLRTVTGKGYKHRIFLFFRGFSYCSILFWNGASNLKHAIVQLATTGYNP